MKPVLSVWIFAYSALRNFEYSNRDKLYDTILKKDIESAEIIYGWITAGVALDLGLVQRAYGWRYIVALSTANSC